jgi:hypothetical protein
MAIVAHLVAVLGIIVLLCREQMAIVAHLVASIGIIVLLCREQMAIVAHLVGVEQLGYEKELGMTPSVSLARNCLNLILLYQNTSWPQQKHGKLKVCL